MKQLRKYLSLLLVLAFIGQAMAADALPCAGMADVAVDAAAHDMSGMSHTGHQMDPAAASGTAGGSCCDAGLCGMSQCQAASALPQSVPPVCGDYVADYSAASVTSSPISRPDALFRPPISR
jgi:hypothetical protein